MQILHIPLYNFIVYFLHVIYCKVPIGCLAPKNNTQKMRVDLYEEFAFL